MAAAAWGLPPWNLAGGHKLTWYLRWLEWTNQRNKKSASDLEAWLKSLK